MTKKLERAVKRAYVMPSIVVLEVVQEGDLMNLSNDKVTPGNPSQNTPESPTINPFKPDDEEIVG